MPARDGARAMPQTRALALRIVRWLDRILDCLAVLALVGMILVLCLQIFYRYVLEEALVWATPVSLFLFVWAVWLGGAIGMRDRTQVRVELAELYLPAGVRRILIPGITMGCAAFLLLAIYKSFTIIERQASAHYDTLPVTRDTLFVVVPVVGSVMFLQLVRVFVNQVRESGAPDRDGRG